MLAVFLGSLVSGFIAVVISTFLIVVIGEIIPQAAFSRHALSLSSRMTPLVWVSIVLLYPIAKPISLVLDKALGGELRALFSKKEIHLLIKEHQEHKKHDIGQQELEIMEAGLIFSERLVHDVMIPRKRVFVLKHDAILNKRLLKTIRDVGYSRIPVEGTTPGDIVGILYTKDLVMFNATAGVTVENVMHTDIVSLLDTDRLGKALSLARSSCIHLIIVRSAKGDFVGVLALEDILEEIIGEIDDEHDQE
jgi:metal transporter CNNM